MMKMNKLLSLFFLTLFLPSIALAQAYIDDMTINSQLNTPNVYMTPIALPATCTQGEMIFDVGDSMLKVCIATNTWASSASTAPLSVGTFDSQAANSNGLTIAASTLYAQSADATHPGMVNTSTQTFAGVKTFSAAPNFSSLTASKPLKLDASKNVTAGAIDLATAEVTGVLPLANGGTNNNTYTAPAGSIDPLVIYNGTGLTTWAFPADLGYDTSAQRLKASAADVKGTLTVGTAGVTTGTISTSGSTSGTIVIQPQAAAGSYNFNLPTGAGSSGQVLTSAGGVSAPMTWTTATNANTASAIVQRDASGNFSAGTITAAISGNASTATALAANPTDCSADTYATTIDAGGNLTCATVTNAGLAGSIALTKFATQADKTIVSNISGGVAAPSANTLSAIIDAAISSTRGSILYRGASGWAALAPGTSTYVLTSNGAGADPSYQAAAGTGTVTSVTFTGDGTVLSSTPSSAVTGSGTVTASINTQAESKVLAGPVGNSASAAAPTFRQLNFKDIFYIPSYVTTYSTSGSKTFNLPRAFYVTAMTTAPAAGDTYTNNSVTWTVLSTAGNGGTWVIASGNGTPTSSGGTLTRATGAGDASITFSAYKAPNNLHVRLVGAGAGGSGSGSASCGTNPTSGGNTNMSGSTAGGGGASAGCGAQGSPGSGGTATCSETLPNQCAGFAGGSGLMNTYGPTTLATAGGAGGASLLGAGGLGQENGAGGAGQACGGGGGGGGTTASTSAYPGPGGGAGATVELWIYSPANQYSPTVGAKGTKQTAGTGGKDGADGADGCAIIEANFN